MKIYVSGPMRGHPNGNRAAFEAAAHRLAAKQFEPHMPDPDNGLSLRQSLLQSIGWIIEHAEALYMLRDFEHSQGAKAERAVAQALGIPITYEDDEQHG